MDQSEIKNGKGTQVVTTHMTDERTDHLQVILEEPPTLKENYLHVAWFLHPERGPGLLFSRTRSSMTALSGTILQVTSQPCPEIREHLPRFFLRGRNTFALPILNRLLDPRRRNPRNPMKAGHHLITPQSLSVTRKIKSTTKMEALPPGVAIVIRFLNLCWPLPRPPSLVTEGSPPTPPPGVMTTPTTEVMKRITVTKSLCCRRIAT